MTEGSPTSQTTTLRSTRVRARIPTLITSLDSAIPFSLLCETLMVNAHGCAAKVPQPLEIGMPVRLRVSPPPANKAGEQAPRASREATARIVLCQPIGGNQPSWVAGIEMDNPGNIWGLTPAPEDWKRFDAGATAIKASAPAGRPAIELKLPVWPLASPAAKSAPPARASDDELKKQLAAQQETIAGLENRLARSLASVPGVVREQLAAAQQETVAQVRKQLGAMLAQSVQEQLPAQTEAMARLQERLATLESLPSAVREQLGETRAALASVTGTVHKQLADAQQQTLAQAREELFAMLAESVQEQFTSQANAIARLRQRLAAFESVPDEVRKQLAEAQQQTLAQARGELDAALAEHVPPLQQELAVCRKQAEDGAQVRAAVAEQFDQLPFQIQQHAQAAFRVLQDQARTELERIIAEARSQDAQETARRQALETSTQALQKELAQARETLESSMRGLPERIQEPIAAAVEDALARAGAEISAELTRELDALHHRGRMVVDELRGAADLLRNEREATSAQLAAAAAKREELQLWLAEQHAVYTRQARRQFEQLAEQQAAYTSQVRQKLEQFASDLAARCAAALEKQIRSDVEIQAERAEADLDQRLGPMLDRASDLRQEVLSLLGTLQRESERCQTQARALLEEKDSVDDWIRERAAEFQKTFHDAMVETTGQIRGRLNMAVEMIAEPVEKLRDQAAQQLQEQAGRQARRLREDADEAAERLRGLRRDLESAVRESLRAQAAETAATFGREIAQAAQRSVDEWRSALANNLESIAGALAQKLPGGEK
jgi:predicted RNA binding protein with dsRBD fold (UPF0201 family)